MNRKTQITIETDRLLIVRTRTSIRSAYCQTCNELVSMITPDMGAELSGISVRAVYRLIEAEKIHSVELPDRSSQICLNSLKQLLNVEEHRLSDRFHDVHDLRPARFNRDLKDNFKPQRSSVSSAVKITLTAEDTEER